MKYITGIRRVAVCAMAAALLAAGNMVTAFAAGSSASDEEIAKIISQKLDNIKVVRSADSSTAAPSDPAASATKILTQEELTAYASKVFEIINKERENAGIAPLTYRDDLAEAALIRAKEIVDLNSHTRPSGEKFSSVFDDLSIQRESSSENLYRGPATPERAMQGWMDSESHRKNILKEKYTSVGVGIYQTQDGKLHWIQLFIEEK